MTEKPIQLGLAGLGTVGSGVYETLCRNHALLEARSKIPFRLKRIAVLNLEKPRETVVPRELLTDDWQDLVNDPEIDIIIELIGGTRQAYDLVTLALRAGKPVVTGNKALLAEYGAEIFKLSAEMGTPIYFEASAGGGIPIIQSLQNSLICNHINSIVGIINGTSNYILSAMGEHGADYADALAQAQKLGFAEEDPSLDVNGWDAAHKALILAMLAYGTTISPDKIYVRGIENITSRDFEFAKKLGYTIKLLVVIRYHEGQEDALELRVQPCFVHDWHILASVNGVFNAISVNGDIVGETLFYGRGAGKNPTASAVISDIITAMRESRYPEYHTGFNPYAKACGIMHINDTVTPYYVRFQVADQPGVIAEIARILATFGIGISATSSAPSHIDEGGAPWNDLVFILHSCPWGQLQKALEEITRISCVAAEPRVLRIEHLLPQS